VEESGEVLARGMETTTKNHLASDGSQSRSWEHLERLEAHKLNHERDSHRWAGWMRAIEWRECGSVRSKTVAD
jgi:hypothetical protein